MMKTTLLFTCLCVVIQACGFQYDPSQPYPVMAPGEDWLERFDQRGLQNAVVSDSLLFCNTIAISQGENYLYCLNLKTGTVAWRAQVKAYAARPVGISGNRVYYVSYVGDVYAFDLQGNLIWSQKLPFSYSGHMINPLTGKLLIISSWSGSVEFDPDSGAILTSKTKLNTGGLLPAFIDKKVVFARSRPENGGSGSDYVKCYDGLTDQLLWEMDLQKQAWGITALDNKVFIWDGRNVVYALDLLTGQLLWSSPMRSFKVGEMASWLCMGVSGADLWYSLDSKIGFLNPVTGEKYEKTLDRARQVFEIHRGTEKIWISVTEPLEIMKACTIKIDRTGR